MLVNKLTFYSIVAILLMIIPMCACSAEFSPGVEIQSQANVNFREDMKYGFWSDPRILKVVHPGDRLTVIKTEKIK